MIPYLLHSSILLGGTYLIYALLISKETFFKLNRGILLMAVVLSITLPLLTIPPEWSLLPEKDSVPHNAVTGTTTNPPAQEVPRGIDMPPTEAATDTNTAVTPVSHSQTTTSSILLSGRTWWIIYFIGVSIFIITFLVQLGIILAKIGILQSFKDGRYRIVELTKDQAPFSFWNSIFINPTKYDEDTFKQILAHEKIHIDQSHFIDKLLAELVVVVLWFNPFAWLYRTAISNNLEYLTDSSMLSKGVKRDLYQLSLLKVSVPQHPLYLTTNFNQSFLKNRITMMNTKKSSARSTWKYLLLLPFFGISMITLNAVQLDLPTTVQQPEELENSDLNNQQPVEHQPTIANQENRNTEYTKSAGKASNPSTNEPSLQKSSTNDWTNAKGTIDTRLAKVLQKHLYSDGLISTTGQKVIIELLADRIFINKRKLSSQLEKKYRNILAEHNLDASKDAIHIVAPIAILSGAMINDNHEYNIQFNDDYNIEERETEDTQIGQNTFEYDRSENQNDQINRWENETLEEYLLASSKLNGSEHALLRNNVTKLTTQHFEGENKHWLVPSFQFKLMEFLQAQNLLSNKKSINMYVRENQVYVNGEVIGNNRLDRIKNLFDAHNVPFVSGLHFMKKGDHIAIVDPVADLDQLKEDVIEHLTSTSLIKSKNSKVFLKLSGHKVHLNDEPLSLDQTIAFYRLIRKHNITPSPGKVIQINRKSKKNSIAMHVGYHMDSTYIGTMELD